jgi:hypothetical protein
MQKTGISTYHIKLDNFAARFYTIREMGLIHYDYDD